MQDVLILLFLPLFFLLMGALHHVHVILIFLLGLCAQSVGLRELLAELLQLIVLFLIKFEATAGESHVSLLALHLSIEHLLLIFLIQLAEVIRDRVVGVLQGTNKIACILTFLCEDEGIGSAFVTRSASSTNAMDIVLGVIRAHIVYHDLDVLDV